MLEVVIIGAIGVAVAVGGLSILRKRRGGGGVRAHLPAPPGSRRDDDGVVLNPSPSQVQPGDDLQFARPADIEAGTYSVEASATYRDDDDETWAEFEVVEIGKDQRYSLAYAQDDEARWQWSLFRHVPQQELDEHEVFEHVGCSKSEKAPKEIAFRGRTWRAQRGSRHYKVWVTDWRVDRREKDEYEARMTEYREVGGEARLSLEVWDDGISVSIAEGPIGEVTLIRR